MGSSSTTTFYIPPKLEWLPASKGKGLEIKGTFSRKNGTIYMDMTFSNRYLIVTLIVWLLIRKKII
jgi:hypothetical protein